MSADTPTESPRPIVAENPFDASRIAPGVRRFRFPSDFSAADWFEAYAAARRIGAIVGPHGIGKTTLIRELLRIAAGEAPADATDERRVPLVDRLSDPLVVAVETAGRPTLRRLVPHESGFERREALRFSMLVRALHARRWVIIDGFESLGPLRRGLLSSLARIGGGSLLVTTHRPLIGLKSLPSPRPSSDLFITLVHRSAAEWSNANESAAREQHQPLPWSDAELTALYERHRGNIREALFELYDRWAEAARRAERSPT
ncbi:MAG TPA: hypothetical protein DCQ98_05230 [Planctomycetaceae bacterium]|nr:hypothetical protein [Planctomycetaceae bacterium]HRF02631.1 ATP-binding protein [Pirellulaceae bacterium]